jgi:prepilin-type N-terminal cleavage/methylation domain-containing protein
MVRPSPSSPCLRVSAGRQVRRWPGSGAFTLIELLVVIGIIALLVGILIPALGGARTSGAIARCQATARALTQNVIAHTPDHDNRYPYDNRPYEPPLWSPEQIANFEHVPIPQSEDDFKHSWFGRLIEKGYLSDDPQAVECAVVDDHRKAPRPDNPLDPWLWYTDYVMNRYLVSRPADRVEEPSRTLLIGEPNQPRSFVGMLSHTVARRGMLDAESQAGLEQTLTGSVSIAYADGHTVRMPIDRNYPWGADESNLEQVRDLFDPHVRLWQAQPPALVFGPGTPGPLRP